MNQDGKPEQRTDMASSSNAPVTSSGGKVLLTLCTSPEDTAPYRHATIRFPSSYQAACAAALKVFAAYIPPDVEAVSLRQATLRADGERVWSIVAEEDWDVCVERQGEEIGVFLPNIIPEAVPYRKVQRPKKLVYLQHDLAGQSGPVPREVNSLEDCVKFARELTMTYGRRGFDLYYDGRIIGHETLEKIHHFQDEQPRWCLLDNAKTFEVLRGLDSRPMWIKVANLRP